MSESNVERYLAWYEKDGDRFIGRTPLTGVSLQQLQELFGMPAGDPMYACFPVAEEQARMLSQHVTVSIDLAKFEYFVEARSRAPCTLIRREK